MSVLLPDALLPVDINVIKWQLGGLVPPPPPPGQAATATRQDQIQRKFDITYTVAKEMLAFTKMDAICELEESADLGQGYKK